MRHGTRSTYVHNKCRCAECRAAQAEYQRKMYATGKINGNYRAKINKRSRQRQQAAAAWVKANRGDVWQEICQTVN
jgi:predicted RNA-binding protein YlxR (DUF448 family)